MAARSWSVNSSATASTASGRGRRWSFALHQRAGGGDQVHPAAIGAVAFADEISDLLEPVDRLGRGPRPE